MHAEQQKGMTVVVHKAGPGVYLLPKVQELEGNLRISEQII